MGLFAKDETEFIYFDEKGKITDKKQDNYFKVKKELGYLTKEKLNNAIGKQKVQMNKDGSYQVEIDNVNEIPINVLTDVIVEWSEDEKITIENLKKVKYTLLKQLWERLQNLYDIKAS